MVQQRSVNEIPVVQNGPGKERTLGVKSNLEPRYRGRFTKSKQLLPISRMETISCAAIRPTLMIDAKWAFPKRDSKIVMETQFTFRVYNPPIIVWSYVLKPIPKYLIKDEFLAHTLRIIKHWCALKITLVEHKLSPCRDIIVQVMPLVTLTRSRSMYTEILIPIDLTNEPTFLLVNPAENYFSHIHANLKAEMDELIRTTVIKDGLPIQEVTTHIRIICPPGSQTYHSPPLLKSLKPSKDITVSNVSFLLKNSSAYPLAKWSLVCQPCPPGHASRTPYAFDGCHLCPKGHYSRETDYPSGKGCLPCPIGFTTGTTGAKSVRECHVDGGAVTRLIIVTLVKIWTKFEQFLVDNMRKEINTETVRKIYENDLVRDTNISLFIWIFLSLYFLIVVCLLSLAVYRIYLYIKLNRIYRAQFRLLLKSTLVGQINLVRRIKARTRINSNPT
ncbi:endonuclease reverse transcriptase [Schistosoma japonicum]|uniref:Endonuclease reverse transcriptase n=1 Tax=Schistosoma japonicum TaxID=6182 RepID=A0A4Z2CP51_SCHJA|nr:Endonuclease-reverse transcriptase [Schistosoma japonicum]TNN06039.1 endonuclease reverse transcriptase [Schistosoma japonicum]